MAEVDLTNKDVLGLMFKDVQDTLNDQNEVLRSHTDVHKNILQTVKEGFDKITNRQDIANGRTRKNELQIALAQGGLAVLIVVALPILIWAVHEVSQIPESIQEALSIYETP